MAKVKEKSGTWFDPQGRRNSRAPLRGTGAHGADVRRNRGPKDCPRAIRVERGLAPAAGFERTEPTHGPVENADFLTSIASARQEAQTMFELSQDLGVSLSLSETLSVLVDAACAA